MNGYVFYHKPTHEVYNEEENMREYLGDITEYDELAETVTRQGMIEEILAELESLGSNLFYDIMEKTVDRLMKEEVEYIDGRELYED